MKKPEGKKTETKGMKLESFEVRAVRMFDNGNVLADLVLNGITVYGVRVVEGKNGDFLSLPQRKGSDGKYYSIVWFPFIEEDQKAILAAIEQKLNEK